MKKTFLARRNGLLSLTEISWGVIVLAIAILILLVRIIAPNFFWSASAPLFRASDAIALKTHTLLSGFENSAALVAANERLTDENTALANENQELLQRMSDITALLGSESITGHNSSRTKVVAGVITRPPESPYDTLMLAAGSNAGVALGMEAFGLPAGSEDGGAVPVGIVSQVLNDFSRVTLFSAPNVVTYGWVGAAGLPLTIYGAGGGVMNASVARSAGVAPGDTVFVPGPGRLPIGVVVRVDDDPSAPSVALRIQPSVNLFSISWVELRATNGVTSGLATSTSP